MLTPEQLEAVRDQVGHICDPINDFLVEDIARRIAEAGQLTSTAAYQVWRAQQLGKSRREIERELQKRLNISKARLRRLMTQTAEVGYRFDLDRLPTAAAVTFAENDSLQRVVAAAVKLAEDDFSRLTQSRAIGFLDAYGKELPFEDAYISCCDYMAKQVITGAIDYNTAIRTATKSLAERGMVAVSYESGVHTSLDAAVRRNTMGFLGLMVEQTQEVTHDQLGCDGWEISAHAGSAPDHEPIQGKQYTDKEYKAINGSLVRRIGTLNCGHIAFPIILGVSAPQYPASRLAKLRADNADGVAYEGRRYTVYEATQEQRRLERVIRVAKRRVKVDKATGDSRLTAHKTRLQMLTQHYNRFSDAVGLRTEAERARIWSKAVSTAKER